MKCKPHTDTAHGWGCGGMAEECTWGAGCHAATACLQALLPLPPPLPLLQHLHCCRRRDAPRTEPPSARSAPQPQGSPAPPPAPAAARQVALPPPPLLRCCCPRRRPAAGRRGEGIASQVRSCLGPGRWRLWSPQSQTAAADAGESGGRVGVDIQAKGGSFGGGNVCTCRHPSPLLNCLLPRPIAQSTKSPHDCEPSCHNCKSAPPCTAAHLQRRAQREAARVPPAVWEPKQARHQRLRTVRWRLSRQCSLLG